MNYPIERVHEKQTKFRKVGLFIIAHKTRFIFNSEMVSFHTIQS
jgi:hypothetical protein